MSSACLSATSCCFTVYGAAGLAAAGAVTPQTLEITA